MSNAIMKADFHGAVLYGARIGDVVYVAMKPVVEAMGLAWHGQFERAKRDPILREGIRVTRIPSKRGGSQQGVVLRLDLVHGWLFTISSARIRDEVIQARVQLFQRECYAVLAKRFLRKGREDDRYTHRQEMRSIHLVNAAIKIGGPRAGLQVWRARGLPVVPALNDANRQGDLFD